MWGPGDAYLTLASILALAEGARRDKGAGDTGALCAQIKMVAGTRNRRSHYSVVPI